AGLVPAHVPAHMAGATTTGATANGATANGATTVGATTVGATTRVAPTRFAPTVGDIIGAFKSRTTVEYIRGVKTCGWTPFPGKLWQRNYYEHIIRNEHALDRIREYIVYNPLRWALDRENPQRTGNDEFDIWLEHYSDIRKRKPS
ncbi:MAG: transposase, partial [Dehalococcoidia bacterium]